jgi:hypothetical protein
VGPDGCKGAAWGEGDTGVSDTIRFILPCHVFTGKKNISLTQNWYRNAHFYEINKVKQSYWPIQSAPFHAEKIAIHYVLHLKDHKRTDLMNWLSIADKFFADWLVGRGYISDDGVKQIPLLSGSVDISGANPETFITADVEILERRTA